MPKSTIQPQERRQRIPSIPYSNVNEQNHPGQITQPVSQITLPEEARLSAASRGS
jgi:hypothetical protein